MAMVRTAAGRSYAVRLRLHQHWGAEELMNCRRSGDKTKGSGRNDEDACDLVDVFQAEQQPKADSSSQLTAQCFELSSY